MHVRNQWMFFFAALAWIAFAITCVVSPRLRRRARVPDPYFVLFMLLFTLGFLAQPKPARIAVMVSMFSALGAMLVAFFEKKRSRTGN